MTCIDFSRCWQCGKDITGKVPFEYFDYKFCTPKCLKEHKMNVKKSWNTCMSFISFEIENCYKYMYLSFIYLLHPAFLATLMLNHVSILCLDQWYTNKKCNHYWQHKNFQSQIKSLCYNYNSWWRIYSDLLCLQSIQLYWKHKLLQSVIQIMGCVSLLQESDHPSLRPRHITLERSMVILTKSCHLVAGH